MKNKINDRGQSLIEYVILVALIALVSVSATKLLGKKISTKLNEVRSQIDSGIPVRLSPDGRQND